MEKRIAVITGGSHGIGLSLANTFQEAGYQVIATSRKQQDVKDSSLISLELDVSDHNSVMAFKRRLSEIVPHVDVLVNNAGIAGPTSSIKDVSNEEWDSVFAVNVRGIFWMCQALLPLLELSKNGGRIINIASMTGKRPLLYRVPYAASKMAVIGLTRSLALELGILGITVNTVSPGYVEGERMISVIKGQANKMGRSEEEIRGEFTRLSPLKRFVDVENVVQTVLFLSSEAAKDITGADFGVTAGVWMD